MAGIMEVSVDDRAFAELAHSLTGNAPRELDRASLAAARRAGTLAFRALRKQADFSASAAGSGRRSDRRRRIKVRTLSSKDGSRLWVGIAGVPIWRIRDISVSGAGRETRINGAPRRRTFRPWFDEGGGGEDGRGRVVFERQGRRPYPILAATEDLDPVPIWAAIGDVDDIYEAEVLKRIDKLLGDA